MNLTLPPVKEKEPSTEKVQFLRINFADQKLPTFKENKSAGITYYGEKNDYPEKLLYLYNKSPKHNAIVTKRAKFINGKECKIEGHPELETNWNKHDTLQQFKYKIELDDEIFGGFAVEVLYDNANKPHYYHINFGKVRTLDHESYEYWPDGSKTKKKDIVKYDAYDPKNIQMDTDPESPTFGQKKRQIIYIRQYRADLGVYPLPSYIGALQYIEIDTRIANFHLNNISNGFTGGTLIQFFKGEPTPEEARETKRRFKGQYGGDDANEAGGIVIQFNNAGETPATITPLTPNELDKQFLMLNDHVQQEIFVGHGVNYPPLFGVTVSDGGIGRIDMAEAYEVYYKDSIETKQEEMDRFIERLLKDMGIVANVQTTKLDPYGKDWITLFEKGLVAPEVVQEKLGLPINQLPQLSATQKLNEAINSLSPLVANKVLNELSTNEVRSLAALPPIPGGDNKSQPAVNTGFSLTDDEIKMWNESDIEIFAQFGEPESDYEYLKFSFAELNEKEVKIMTAINSNEKVTVDQISQATKIDTSEVETILESLDAKNKIKWTGNKIRITDAGRNDINKVGGFDNLALKYKYALAPEAPDLKPGGKSRPFCIKLMELSRLYTREDIDKLSTILGYDVWRRRGGWYHNPETDVNEPHCRHTWRQVVVRKKQ